MYPAIWLRIRGVVPFVSATTASLFSSKLLENFSGKRSMSSLPNRLICCVLTFPKPYTPCCSRIFYPRCSKAKASSNRCLVNISLRIFCLDDVASIGVLLKILNLLNIYLGYAEREHCWRVNGCLFLGLRRANGRKNAVGQNLEDGGGSVRTRTSRGRNPTD
jgi:hypothetical protein